MSLTINFDVVGALMVLLRVTSVMTIAPVFGPVQYPSQVKILFGIFLAVVIWPTLSPMAPITGGAVELVARVCGEVLFGAALGFGVQILFSLVAMSGQLVAMTGGLAMAQVFDPLSAQEVTMVSQLKNIVMFIIFIQLELHHVLIRALIESFRAIPPGGVGLGQRAGLLLNDLFAGTLATSVQLALPAIVMVLLIQAGMAILARMAPAMNVFFSVGHTVTFIVTMGVIALSLPVLKAVLVETFERLIPFVHALVRILAQPA